MRSLWICFLISLISSISWVSAKLSNVTIDDASPKIIYSPADGWYFGPTCQGCTATPNIDVSQTLNRTWHDGTSNRLEDQNGKSLRIASTSFNGTAVYVFCILANTQDNPTGYSEMFFLIDGQVAGSFNHTPNTNGPKFVYNVPVFATTSLSPGSHSLTIQNGSSWWSQIASSARLPCLLMMVRRIQQRPPGTPSGSSVPAPASASQSGGNDCTGKIVGAVLGTIAGLLLLLVAFLWYRQRNATGPSPVLPAVVEPTPPKPAGPWVPSFMRFPHHAKSPSTVHATNASTFSFNPAMLVRPMINRSRTLLFRPPLPLLPLNLSACPRWSSTAQIPCVPSTPIAHLPHRQCLDPRTAPMQPMSIEQWQQRTQREAQDRPPRLSVSEVDLSSYWEMSSSAEPQPMRPPQRPAPARRFTVVNT